jgi:hypothetical protein
MAAMNDRLTDAELLLREAETCLKQAIESLGGERFAHDYDLQMRFLHEDAVDAKSVVARVISRVFQRRREENRDAVPATPPPERRPPQDGAMKVYVVAMNRKDNQLPVPEMMVDQEFYVSPADAEKERQKWEWQVGPYYGVYRADIRLTERL